MREVHNCECCDDADATHVALIDTGDHPEYGAGARYMRVCKPCSRAGYSDPEPLTDEWERWFSAPWNPTPIDVRRDREWRARHA